MPKLVITPPTRIPLSPKATSVFLAGSIEMGKAVKWQEEAITKLVDLVEKDLVIYNPRRDDWDSSWENVASNPQFKDQVEWEQYYLENCNFRFFFFAPNTASPITLLELGQSLTPYYTIVCCPHGYDRKGNVDVTCENKRINVYLDMNHALEVLATRINSTKFV